MALLVPRHRKIELYHIIDACLKKKMTTTFVAHRENLNLLV